MPSERWIVTGQWKANELHTKKHSVETLKEGARLNDEPIDAYMSLLAGQGNQGGGDVMFWTSMTFTKYTEFDSAKNGFGYIQSWVEKLQKPGYKKICVPVFVSTSEHWFLIVVDFVNKTLRSMDSLRSKDRAYERKKMMEWVKEEWSSSSSRWKGEFVPKKWKSSAAHVPKQTNEVDCGVFTCMYAAFASNSRKMIFSQENMPKMRARMARSILYGSL